MGVENLPNVALPTAVPTTGPAVPTAGAVPDATVAPALQTATPTVAADQNVVAAKVDWQPQDVNIDNIDVNEGHALDGMLQNFMNDGNLSKEEWAVYEKTRAFYAQDGAKPAPAPAPAPSGGGAPAPSSPPAPTNAWPVGDQPISGTAFSSVGDPHETSGDGLHFDNEKTGDFVKLKSASGDFMLQTRQEHDDKGRWAGATLNKMAAVKSGNDSVVYDGKSKTLTINGQQQPLTPGASYNLPGGGSVKVNADGVSITSAKGDVVNVKQQDGYIDITGNVSSSRKDGEIRGSLGAFDNDTTTNDDLLGRTGNTPIGKPGDKASEQAFEEAWRVQPGEGLLPAAGPTGGGAPDADKAADEALFNKLDITQDGWLSGTEVGKYKRYDKDGNGELTKDEFMAGRAHDRDLIKQFFTTDKNKDGYLSGNELTPELKAMDADGNGRLTKEELMKALGVSDAEIQAALNSKNDQPWLANFFANPADLLRQMNEDDQKRADARAAGEPAGGGAPAPAAAAPAGKPAAAHKAHHPHKAQHHHHHKAEHHHPHKAEHHHPHKAEHHHPHKAEHKNQPK